MIQAGVIIIYVSFVLDFLVWPVPSEASTYNLIRKESSMRSKFLRSILFINNLTVYFYPLIMAVLFPDLLSKIEPMYLSLIFGIVIAARILTLYGAVLLHKRPDQLVTKAIFRFTRNPVSTGLHFTMIGLLLLFPVWWIFILFLIMVVDIHFKIKKEEKYLLSTYEVEYRKYKEKTPRYIYV